MLQHLGAYGVPGGRLTRVERNRLQQVELGEVDLDPARGGDGTAAFYAGRAVFDSPHCHVRVGLPQVDGELTLPTADIQHRLAGPWSAEQAHDQPPAVDVGRGTLGHLPVGVPGLGPVVRIRSFRLATTDPAVRGGHRRNPAVAAAL